MWATISEQASKIDLSYENIQSTLEQATGYKYDDVIEQASDYADTVKNTDVLENANEVWEQLKQTNVDDVFEFTQDSWCNLDS